MPGSTWAWRSACASVETLTLGRGRIGPDRPTAPGADTIFEIGSITKVFTATVRADNARGPGLARRPGAGVLPENSKLTERGRPITLADLETHTSGLPRLPRDCSGSPSRKERTRMRTSASNACTRAVCRAAEARARREDAVLELRDRPARPRARPPSGEELRGAGGGADLPTAWPGGRPSASRRSKADRFAQGHNRRGKPVPHWDLPALAGAGALRSTVADLLTFLTAQLGHGPAQLADAIELTHESRAQPGPTFDRARLDDPHAEGQRFPAIWHDGGTGGFRSVAGFVKETETAVIVLSNSLAR